MIGYSPVAPGHVRRAVLAQATIPAPAPAPVVAPATVVTAPAAPSPIVTLVGWTVLGMGAGAVTGYAVGKGLGKRDTPYQDAVIGGLAGGAATLLCKLL